MKEGKLRPKVLERLLKRAPVDSQRVVLGPRVGDDAAVVRPGELVALKSDPVTFAGERLGWYAVNVNANDCASVGARPLFFLATLLLPPSADESVASGIFDDIAEACEELGVSLVGGHTEFTSAVTRPVVSGAMAGEVVRLLDKRAARPGDRVVMTKAAAIEGTSIIARDARAWCARTWGEDFATRAAGLLFDPGISVVADALAVVEIDGVRAMHDPTEGGVATGLWELARAAGLGVLARADEIPLLEETRAIADEAGLDPLGMIASGSLLIVCDEGSAAEVTSTLEEAGVPARAVGEMRPEEEGMTLERDGERVVLLPRERDEVLRFFEEIRP